MPSMDIVNKLEMPEVVNAIEQAKKEIVQRFDFKGTNTTVELNDKDKTILVKSASDNRVAAAVDVLEGRLVKRSVSLKCLDKQKIEPGPNNTSKQTIKLRDGIDEENAKKIVKQIKEKHPKVQPSIQGNAVRASSKSRDFLQEVIADLRGAEFPLPLQFINFRD